MSITIVQSFAYLANASKSTSRLIRARSARRSSLRSWMNNATSRGAPSAARSRAAWIMTGMAEPLRVAAIDSQMAVSTAPASTAASRSGCTWTSLE